MNNLKITLIQTTLHWENIDKNLEMFTQKLSQIDDETDLVVLPEMFNTGFSIKSIYLAEEIPDRPLEPGKSASKSSKTLQWMANAAHEKKCVITGSLIIKENGNYYNRLIWMSPDGSFKTYDKRHLFRFLNEHKYFTGGDNRIIVELNGWRICPLICYDLRFPVWIRNRLVKKENIEMEYDVLVCIANWPEARSYPWRILLLARAIENQCYVIGVNRVGKDGNDVVFSGDSSVVDAYGRVISKTKPYDESIETINLSYSKLQKFRESFPQGLDGDEFVVQ
ncbi:MAG: amidohydrolase [Bacteroidota bacterium]